MKVRGWLQKIKCVVCGLSTAHAGVYSFPTKGLCFPGSSWQSLWQHGSVSQVLEEEHGEHLVASWLGLCWALPRVMLV